MQFYLFADYVESIRQMPAFRYRIQNGEYQFTRHMPSTDQLAPVKGSNEAQRPQFILLDDGGRRKEVRCRRQISERRTVVRLLCIRDLHEHYASPKHFFFLLP